MTARFKVNAFSELVPSVGSSIREERETVTLALDTGSDRKQSVTSAAVTANLASINEALDKSQEEVLLAPSSAPDY